MLRIDTHNHIIPPDYREMLRKAGIDEAGGRALPDWSADAALQTMAELGVPRRFLELLLRYSPILKPRRVADTAGVRETRAHHLRV